MTTREYKNLGGMELSFVLGVVEANAGERAIACAFTFDLALDFARFKDAANKYVPNYLEGEINAIRPELDGLAYHISYDYFADQAGKIASNEALFRVFTGPDSYFDGWSSGVMEQRYHKPIFQILDGKLRLAARTDFRWEDPQRLITIADLPIIRFQWALNVMEGHEINVPGQPGADIKAPSSMVVFTYTSEDRVEVDGQQMYRGTRYVRGWKLDFGPVTPQQILTAQ
ncbi:hypothetical protein [Pseudomonas sp. Pdm06]|uniref:hypothetical protein n=1 Tax=Pseudomonas sp. Pdm06 TaxID=1790044 RepID=UPI00177D860C|nr:hypothetical protein [Pseudomonas sp. Pdm06]MBD9461482.1 hypothetical protein [Pseudomonas sp. Pdm06]